jgi:hypothetical protein
MYFTHGDKWVFNEFLDRMEDGGWISSFMKEFSQQISSTRNGIPTKWVCLISWWKRWGWMNFIYYEWK